MSLHHEILHMIRQFCDEEKYYRTLHTLEEETGFHFDRRYFEEMVTKGLWDTADNYLSAFTAIEKNEFSANIYFLLRRQKLLEAIEKNDVNMGLAIVLNELKYFATSHAEVYKEMTSLLTMDDSRKREWVASYGDSGAARKKALEEMKPHLEANPDLRQNLKVFDMGDSRLKSLVNQRFLLYLQQRSTLHDIPSGIIGDQGRLSDPQPSQRNQSSPSTDNLENPIALPPTLFHPGSSPTVVRRRRSVRNHPSSVATRGTMRNSQNVPRISSSMPVDKMVGLQSKVVVDAARDNNMMIFDNFPKDIPRTVQRCITLNLPPSTMDFHPLRENLLLVGSLTGDVELWEVSTELKMFWSSFAIWRPETLSMLCMTTLERDPQISVRRVKWSPYGSIFAVAFSKHIVQLYSFNVMTNYIEKHLQIEAHFGGVNDLAFGTPSNQLILITCGDDMVVKMWNTQTGSKTNTLEGHTAPIYSLTLGWKEGIDFVFSTSMNGEIKAWAYDETAPRKAYTAPARSCAKMIYNADWTRLFCCGTNINIGSNGSGESYLVEWDDSEGSVSRSYQGMSSNNNNASTISSSGSTSSSSSAAAVAVATAPAGNVAQVALTKNRFLIVGDDHMLKVWDIHNHSLMLAAVGARESLPAKPYLCFNKSGNVVGVFGRDGKIKVFANEAGTHFLRDSSLAPFTYHSPHLSIPLVKEMQMTMRPRELSKLLNSKRYLKVYQVAQCRSLRLPSQVQTKNQICRLEYTQSGNGILALSTDGVHLLWKWPSAGNECGSFGTATVSEAPEAWKPKGRFGMLVNEMGSGEEEDDDHQQRPHCFAISKNDSYVVSSSGKTIALFNMMTFERMRICGTPPPTATCIAFCPPDNNIIAIGFEDSTIQIYNIRMDMFTYKLSGHSKRISGLAFSNTLRLLVSSAVDAEIMTWDSSVWQQKKSTALKNAVGWVASSDTSETAVQFHRDQRHFLAIHQTQLALYEASNLQSLAQWMVGNFSARISNGAFSSDNKHVYTVMKDGTLMIFNTPNLIPHVVLPPCLYLPPPPMGWSGGAARVYPVVIAAHPQKANQFAVGLSDGGVVVFEPPHGSDSWGPSPPPQVGNAGVFFGNNTILID